MATKISKKKCLHPRWARFGTECDLCGATENLPPTPETPVLPEGIYTLNRPIPNPFGKDGRSNDWDKQNEIEVGLYYVFNLGTRRYIERAHNNGYTHLGDLHPAYDDMIANMTPAQCSDAEWLSFKARTPGQGWAASPEALIHKLMERGELSRSHIEHLIAANNEDEERENE